jgi:hypothetical protein
MYSEVRTVDMSAHNGNAGPWLPLLGDGEGEQGALVSERRT